MNERPLVAFTLLGQAAAGAFLVVTALELGGGALATEPAARALATGLLVAIGLAMAAALAVSLFHLGSPAGAWRATGNLRRSWLSRELLLALLFAAGSGALAALRASGRGTGGLRTVLAGATALAAVALVHAMARVYRVRTVAAWDTPRTTVSFFATTLLLGALSVASGLAVARGLPDALVAVPLRWLGLVAAAGFLVGLAGRGRGTLHAVRRGLLLAGFVLAVGLLLGGGGAPAVVFAALAAALAAETLGRYLFYVEGLERML